MNQFIPVFEPSGQGLTKDFLQIKKNEMIISGWYKGQLHKLFTDITGQEMVDGVLCYGTTFDIGYATCSGSNTKRDKDINRFLDLLGFDENAKNDLCNARKGSRVTSVLYRLREEYTFTEDDFLLTYELIKTALNGVYRIEIEGVSNTYLASVPEEDRIATEAVINPNDSTDYYMEDRNLIRFYDENDVDITDEYDTALIYAVRTMIWISGERFIQFDSVEKTGEEAYSTNVETNDLPIVTNYIRVLSLRKHTKIFNPDFKDDYLVYIEAINQSLKGIFGSGKYSTNDSGDQILLPYSYRQINMTRFWEYREVVLESGAKSDSLPALLYQRPIGLYSNIEDSKVWMRVNGLKKSSPNLIGYALSQYSDIKVNVKKKKGSFLGIGGFVGNFFSGIINLVVSVISAFAGLVYEIPALRLVQQVTMFALSGDWTTDKDEFKAKLTRMILFAIAVVIAVLFGPEGAMMFLSIALSSLLLLMDLQDIDATFENIQEQLKLANASKAIKDAEDEEEDTPQTTSVDAFEAVNELIYERLYDPYGDIDNTYVNQFDDGGMFDLKFSIYN